MSSNFNSNNETSVDVYLDSDNPDSSAGSDTSNGFARDSVDILTDDNNSVVAGTSSNLNRKFIGKKGQVNKDNNDIKNKNVGEILQPPSASPQHDPQPQQEAFLEIEQVELKSIPKTPRDRLKQRLTDVNQLTFYPGAEIDLGTTPMITALKNETGELILRLEHKSNVVIDEPAGVNMEQISSYFKEDFLDDGTRVTGGNASRAVDSRYMKFCDENGRLIFRGICEKQYTAVKCGADVLGYIDGTALEMTSTPNVIAKNVKNEILFEIPINNEKDASLTAPKPQDEVNAYSNNEIIAKMGQSVTEKGTSFGIKFSRDLKGETKAVLITAAFLVYSSTRLFDLQAAEVVPITPLNPNNISGSGVVGASDVVEISNGDTSVGIGMVEDRSTGNKSWFRSNRKWDKLANCAMLFVVVGLTAGGSVKYFMEM